MCITQVSNVIARVLITGKEKSQSEIGDAMMEVEVRVLCFEDGGKDNKAMNAGSP